MYKKVIDGKPVIVKANSKNIPPLTEIRKVYAKIPDNKRIPIVFETKEQYLDEYIKNQEKAKGTKFPEWQKKQYKHQELQNMQNIVSRYTTNHNPYIDRRVVFFNDHKIPVKQFHDSALHEYGHELWEKNPKIRKDWKSVSRTSSPTSYGQTSKQEDFAESFMLAKTGRLQDPKRERILSDAITQNRALPAWHGNIERQTIQNPNYRKIAFTGNHAQISLMSIKPGQDIGLEKHDKVDQFFRIEQGKAQFILNKGLTKFSEGPSGAAMIPAGTWHNIKSVGKQPLKLYTIYSPPNHPAGTIQKDKPSHDDIEDPTIEIERWQREALLEQALNPTVDPTLTEPSSFEQAYSTTNTDFDQIYAKGMLGGGFDTAIKTIIPYSSTPEFKYKVLGETKTYNPEFETSDIGGKVNIIAGRRLGNPALADYLAQSDVKIPSFGGQVKEVTKDRTSWNLAKVYHGTEKAKAWFIKKEGLKTAKELDADMGIKSEENISSMSEKTNPNLTYYFDKPHHALSWAKVVSDQSGGTPAVLEVDIPDKELQPDWNMPFGKPLSKKGGVPPEKITELDIKKIRYPEDDKDSKDKKHFTLPDNTRVEKVTENKYKVYGKVFPYTYHTEDKPLKTLISDQYYWYFFMS